MLECPVCGGHQKESAFALSSYCRSCGVYFKIHKGRAVENRPAPVNPFGSNRPQPVEEAEAPLRKPIPRRRPVDPIREAIFASGPPEVAATMAEAFPAASPLAAAPSRSIECRQCEHTHDISPLATSTVCPRCGLAVSLRDHNIDGDWTHPIDTRGDVFIGSNGRLDEVSIRCVNLTVEGRFTGSVHCEGDFVMRRNGHITGPVQCKRLVVDHGAEVEFLNPVHADEVIIDGKVIGDIVCKGCLSLKEKATLMGDIHISSLAVSEGARHSGLVHTVAAQ